MDSKLIRLLKLALALGTVLFGLVIFFGKRPPSKSACLVSPGKTRLL